MYLIINTSYKNNMNIDCYVFEESYLLNIDYKICNAQIILNIDAKISVNHSRASQIKKYEDSFEELQIILNNVQYFRGINSISLKDDPNDDIGDIYNLYIDNSELELEDNIRFEDNGKFTKMLISKNGDNIFAKINTKSKSFMFIEFSSDYIAFRAAFTDYKIEVINNEING